MQSGDHIGPEVFIEMHQHFRIAVRPEAMSGGLELPAQAAVVVNLPIEHDGDRTIFVTDGLPASADIDDAQSAHAERHSIRYVISVGVGAAMRYGVAHRP